MVYHRSSESGGSSKRPVNTFANDGSFMEMFKKLQEQQGDQSSSSKGPSESGGNKTSDDPSTKTEPKEGDAKAESSSSSESKTATSSKPVLVGKRRGGRFLATGKVKKLKAGGQDEEEAPPKDAWSLYLAEVKKYKQTTCEEEGKTRPLVKEDMPTAIMAAAQPKLETAPFDPRFPNTNQTKYCYQSYLDYHRCRKVRGESYEPCNYFHKVFTSMCPHGWVEKWDTQIEEGNFPGKI